MRKGILLAGGRGTRLHPLTYGVSKQLLPVFDKPMIFYPLWTLRACGVKEILVITNPDQMSQFRAALGDGRSFGCKLEYTVQHMPKGIAEALIIGQQFVGKDDLVLALGDNILFGYGLKEKLSQAVLHRPATILAYPMSDPHQYGVVELDPHRPILAKSIEEKPRAPRSNFAVPGLYILPNDACQLATKLVPSRRNELEITDLIRVYIESASGCVVEQLGQGVAWFDCGTHDSLLDAANFVAAVTKRQGINVCDPREFCSE